MRHHNLNRQAADEAAAEIDSTTVARAILLLHEETPEAMVATATTAAVRVILQAAVAVAAGTEVGIGEGATVDARVQADGTEAIRDHCPLLRRSSGEITLVERIKKR